MKSFKHGHLFEFKFMQVQSTFIVILTAQTDLGLKSITFSLKINKFPTFSEINQGWQCLNNFVYMVR